MAPNLHHSHANRVRSSRGGEGVTPQIFREPTLAETIALSLMHRERHPRPQPSRPRKFSWEKGQ